MKLEYCQVHSTIKVSDSNKLLVQNAAIMINITSWIEDKYRVPHLGEQ